MKRHPFDPFALALGLFSFGIGWLFLLTEPGTFQIQWLVPIMLGGIGALLVAAALKQSLSTD